MNRRLAVPLSTAVVAAALAAGLAACGGGSSSNQNAALSSTGPGSATTHKRDRDNDGDNNNDDGHVLAFGHVPSASETTAITTLVKRYFAAAAAEQGAKACSMLAPFIAESVAERNGDSLHVHGASCGPVMTALFRVRHKELQTKQPTMKVLRVGVEGNRSLVALEFPAIHEDRQTVARRIDGRWRILNLLDGIIE